MHTGQVVWFNDTKGFGLIEAEGGQTVFVHHTAILFGTQYLKTLSPGQKVLFDLYEDETKGYLARNVSQLSV